MAQRVRDATAADPSPDATTQSIMSELATTKAVPLKGGASSSDRAPIPPTELTMGAIRAAIPAHCFKRSLWHSLRYLAQDLTMIAVLGVTIWCIDTHPFFDFLPDAVKRFVAWPMYWWWQGAVMTGVWVLAHECGHQAFAETKIMNDSIGFILHSALLVPYFSWKRTHSTHHKNTNHMEHDQVFVPPKFPSYVKDQGVTIDDDGSYQFKSPIAEAFEESPLGDLFGVLIMFTLGWPAYLLMNVAGQDYGPGTNHFNPRAKMFMDRDYWDIVASDFGVLAALGALVVASMRFGTWTVVKYYGVPYMVVNSLLVLYTYLQHSHKAVPHYKPKEWNFVRGALCSVDRDYGILNILNHHIGDTHVAHHLFSQMPFYHAQEATDVLKKVLGQYYSYDYTPIPVALMQSWSQCKYVDPADGDIMYFKSLKNEYSKKSK